MEYQFELKTKAYFGQGITKNMPNQLKDAGFSRIGIVVDEAVFEAPATKNLISSLNNFKLSPLYILEGRQNEEPDYDYLDCCAANFKKYDLDCLIGIGGGSTLDLCKGIAVLMRNPGKGIDYRGMNKVRNPSLPTILIPTTAGTGSEVTYSAVFIDKTNKVKMGINGKYVSAFMAFLDPDFTASCPRKVAISSGLDALVHALEAFMTTQTNPIIWRIAIQSWVTLFNSFASAINNPQDDEARLNMLLGSYLAGITLRYSAGGIAGALAYPIGVEYKVPHGLAGGVFLKYIIAMNIAGGYKDYSLLYDEMNGEYRLLDSIEKSKRFLERFNALLLSINAPLNLKDFNIPRADIDRIIRLTIEQRKAVLQNNPILVTEGMLLELLDKVL